MLPDSTEVEHVMKPNEVTVVRGSMNHRLRMSPQDVEAELRDDPVRVFRQLLSESPRGAKASQLKDALYGMDKALVDKAWQRAKKGLDSSADVRRSDSRVPTYSLVEPIPAEPSSDTGLAAAPVKDSSTSDASRATGGPLGPEPSSGDREIAAGEVTPADPPPTVADPLIELLLREGLVEEHKSLASLVRAPLALTLALRRLKATDLRGVVPVLPTSHLILCAMLLGPGKEGVLRDGVSKVSADAYDDVLRAGIAELRGRAPVGVAWPRSSEHSSSVPLAPKRSNYRCSSTCPGRWRTLARQGARGSTGRSRRWHDALTSFCMRKTRLKYGS